MKKPCFLLGVVMLLLFLRIPEPAVLSDGAVPLPDETKYVALTFDDGPHPVQTRRLLDGLLERGASATFFLIGERIVGNEELVRRMEQEGHQIGNHTWSHISLQEAEPAVFQAELQQVDTVLRAILGEEKYWVRPPYGQIRGTQMSRLKVPLVKWSVDPRDWESRDAEKVVQAVLDAVEPGSIILLHDIHSSSVDAALQLVDRLEVQGYIFVTVEELFALSGIETQPGVMYRATEGQIISEGTA